MISSDLEEHTVDVAGDDPAAQPLHLADPRDHPLVRRLVLLPGTGLQGAPRDAKEHGVLQSIGECASNLPGRPARHKDAFPPVGKHPGSLWPASRSTSNSI